MDNDKQIFGGKKFSSLLEEIYSNQRKKDTQIYSLINELKPLIKDIGDATLIVPLIKEYLEIAVKNDDQLVKLAAIIQRIQNVAGDSNNQLGLSEKEREQLLESMEELKKSTEKGQSGK